MCRVSFAALLLLIPRPAPGDDDFAVRLERLEAQVAALQEENRSLREAVQALAAAAVDTGPGAASPVPVDIGPAPVSAVPPPAAIGPKVKVGGQLRLRPEYRDRLKPDAAGSAADASFGERARASVAVETERLKAFVEVQDARAWGTETATTANDRNVDLHQAYLALPDMGRSGISLTLGRQELAYGDERLIGALDWATTGRSFDGGVLRYAWKRGSVDAVAALVNDRKTAARGSGDVVLTGLYGRLIRGHQGRELDLYLLNLGDGAKAAGEAGGQETSRITTAGVRGRYGLTTGLQASAEGALQFGHRGPDGHAAHAWAVAAGYVFDVRHRPGLRFEWDGASGDGDAKDARSREFQNLFPTNHPFYGYADLLGWRNMQALRGTVFLAPREGHQLSIDVHRLRLRESRGAWKDAGGEVIGQDPSGASGREIGDELDFLYRLPMRKDLALLFGYSAFFPGRMAEAVRGKGAQSFGYAQVLFRF